MQASTRTMARIVGPFLLVLGAALLMRADALTLLVPTYLGDAPLMLLTGVVTLAIGLTMVAAHHSWNGFAAIVITIFGILTAIRGAVILIAPELLGSLWGSLGGPHVFWIACPIMALIGLWLTFVGWFSKTSA